MANFRGTIQAVIERNDPPYRLTKRDRFFSGLKISPSKKYGAELKFFEPPFLGGYSATAMGPQVMLKIINFEKHQYRYYWPIPPATLGSFMVFQQLFWVDDHTLLFVFTKFNGIFFQKHRFNPDLFTLEKTWEHSERNNIFLCVFKSELFTYTEKNYVVISEFGKQELTFHELADDVIELTIKYPCEIVKSDATYVTGTGQQMVLNGSVYLVGERKTNGETIRDVKYLIRASIADIDLNDKNWLLNLDRERFQVVMFPSEETKFVYANNEWILYKLFVGGMMTYYALDLLNFTWKSIEVPEHRGEDFAIVDGSSLILFNQYEVEVHPVKKTPINYRIYKSSLGSNDDTPSVLNYLTESTE